MTGPARRASAGPMARTLALRARVLKALKPYIDGGQFVPQKALAESLGITGGWLTVQIDALVISGEINRTGRCRFTWGKSSAPKPTHTINAYPDIPLSRLMGRR